MPEPIPMEKYRMAKRAPTRPADPNDPDLDYALERICYFLPGIIAAVPITPDQLWKLKCAIVREPRKIEALLRKKILPFINSLPDPDRTIVAVEIGRDVICLGCLTADEKVDGTGAVDHMTREEMDEYDQRCIRCGKSL